MRPKSEVIKHDKGQGQGDHRYAVVEKLGSERLLKQIVTFCNMGESEQVKFPVVSPSLVMEHVTIVKVNFIN